MFPPVWQLIGQRVSAGGDAAEIDAAPRALDALAADLDEQLVGRADLCDAFSVADIAAFVMLSAATTLGAPVPERFEPLHGRLGRMASRPAVAKNLRGMLEFFQSH